MRKVHRIFRVDVGNLSADKAQKFLEKWKKENVKPLKDHVDYMLPSTDGKNNIEIIETGV